MASNVQNPVYTRGAPRSSRDRIREQFLDAIRINKPEVLASLAEYVLPIYRSVYEIIPSAMDDAEVDILVKTLFHNIRSKSRLESAKGLINHLQDEMMFWSPILERDASNGEKDGVPEYNVKLSLDDPDNVIGLEEHEQDLFYRFRDVFTVRKSKQNHEGINQSYLDLIGDLGDGIYDIYRYLYHWSLHWNLSDKWFLTQSLHTLNRWCRESITTNWDWAYTPKLAIVYSPFYFDFPFTYAQWYPEADSWPVYKKKARARLLVEFEEKINAYREQREPTVKKRLRARSKRSEIHFLWLIDFQIHELEIPQIVEKYFDRWVDLGHDKGLDYSTVWEAIVSLATALPLTLRPKKGKS